MHVAPASGAPPWVARTEIVTTACSEIGLTGDALAESVNAPPDAGAGGGAAGAGACGFGAAAMTGGAAGGCCGAGIGALGGGGIGSSVGVPTGCWDGASSCGFAS